jgi:hypothetical protein
VSDEADKKNELQKASPVAIDGIDGWEDRYVDDVERDAAGNLLASTIRLSFTNESTWIHSVSKEPLATDFAPVVVDVERTIVDWSDKQRPITRVLTPGERIPDLEAMNEAVPKEKWSTDLNGQPRGPFQLQYVTFLLDLKTLDRYSFPTSTVGGSIATRELVDKIRWMRRYRGNHVCPQVLLSDTFMRTRFGGARGGRQRPHFIIKQWMQLGGGSSSGGPELPAPSPSPVPPPNPTAQPAPQSDLQQRLARSPAAPAAPVAPTQPGLPTVEEPSLAEELNDSIDF